MLWLAVLVRIVANPFSNVFQKVLTRKGADSLLVITATHGLLTAASVPLWAMLWIGFVRGGVSGAFWGNVSLCAAMAVAGNALIVAALRRADLSVLGPINAYKSVVSLVPGALLLHEVPGIISCCGIGLIVAGSYFLVDHAGDGGPRRNLLVRFFADRGVQFRLAALVVSAVEAVFLKRALLVPGASPLLTFLAWCVLGLGFALVAAIVTIPRERIMQEASLWRAGRRPYALLALSTGLMQFSTLVTFRWMQVGPSLALFQTSTLLSVFLGHRVFRERHFARRMIGSAVMVAGAVLILNGG